MGITKAALGRLAVEVREELELSDDQPFDPYAWADEYGVPFVSLAELADTTDAVGHFLRARPERWSAALLKNGTGHVVVYNSAHAAPRVLSNLAHEVAHLVAEHALDSNWAGNNRCSGAGKGQENEAAELAGALLVPPEIAKLHDMRGTSPRVLASRYQVSMEMARWRMAVSGGKIIADRYRRRNNGR